MQTSEYLMDLSGRGERSGELMGREPFDIDGERGADRTDGGSAKAVDTRPPTVRRGAVRCRTLVRLVNAGEYLRVVTQLRYDSFNPYSVSMVFNLDTDEPVEWEFGRDLLSEGRQQVTGMGDVRIWPSDIRGHNVVFISLRSGADMEVVAVSATLIDAFLERTHQIVPAGQEQQLLDVDGVVDRMLDGPS
ncbi:MULTISPECIES: SsgA family sporulation/cell division regulator [Streptomyces]|uniref:SsgA family sporulation/cell division regulator n=1 Tax=Streptomyces cadmiisoli TaxID=2184053 RepID=A0A2Z4IUW5_9ACTN|nr:MULTISPECIES: SsgA family sporulation/cell division regulator [Streptomyces]AWW36554.1 hypothetical protein DN051_07895 [Streptomyces cadmiisoli]